MGMYSTEAAHQIKDVAVLVLISVAAALPVHPGPDATMISCQVFVTKAPNWPMRYHFNINFQPR